MTNNSGISEDGTWTPAFEGQRPPFEPGHELSMKHGAYANVQLGPRVDELADQIRPHITGYTPADEIALRGLCLAIARLERSAAVAEQGGFESERFDRLRADERGWANTLRRYLKDLALTPSARVALGVNVLRGQAAQLTVTALAHMAAAEEDEKGSGS